MFKSIMAIVMVSSGLAAVSLPANAAQAPHVATNCEAASPIKGSEALILGELTHKGYKVTGIEEWDHCIRAFIVKADGTQGMALFQPGTLDPVKLG